MTRTLCLFESFGVVFSITRPRSVPKRAIQCCLPPGTKLGRGRPSRRYRITKHAKTLVIEADGELLAHAGDVADLVQVLEGDIALHVAATAPKHVFIHAGVVAVHGRAVLIPGRSFAGKSTLVARLVDEGATYYSDEYAVLDSAGRVLPYPRPMSLRQDGEAPRRIFPKRRGRRPLAVSWVLSLKYRQGAKMSTEIVRGGRLALMLMDNAVAARLAPRRILPVLRCAVAGAKGRVGERGDASAAARQILLDCL